MLHCHKSTVHLCPCALHLLQHHLSTFLGWAGHVGSEQDKNVSDKQDKSICRSWSPPPPAPEHWAQPVPPFKNPLLRCTCPSVSPVGVWQHSQKLSGCGRQTAWLDDVKSLKKETELASCPGHALVSMFLPLLLVFLIMLVWFVSLSSWELASQLVPHSVIIIFHLYTHHSCT